MSHWVDILKTGTSQERCVEPDSDTVEETYYSARRSHVVDTRRSLKKELAYHLSAVNDVHRRLNDTLPISQLPPEILGSIFIISRRALARNSRVASLWLGISHVCHQWRAVALDTPQFWAEIAVYGKVTKPEFVRLCVQRSKNASYSIQFHPDYHDLCMDHLRLIMPNLHRAHSLDFRAPSEVFHGNDVVRAWPSSMPLLTTLKLTSMESKKPLLPAFIVHLSSPALRTLDLKYFRQDWTTHMLPQTLTTLRFSLSSAGSGSTKEISEIAANISRLVLLQTLSLTSALPIIPEEADPLPHISVRYPLPYLSSARVISSSLSGAFFLNHFYIPPTCNVFFEAETMRHPAILGAAFALLLESDHAPPIVNFVAEHSRMQLERTAGIGPVLEFQSMLGAFGMVEDIELYALAYIRLPIEHVTTFTLNVYILSHLSLACRLSLLLALPNTEVLTFTQDRYGTSSGVSQRQLESEMFELLSMRTDPHNSQSYPLPNLAIVRFRKVSFRNPIPEKNLWTFMYGHAEPTDFTFVDELLKTLKAREAAGMKMPRIELEFCRCLYKSDVARLQQYCVVEYNREDRS